MEVHQLSCWPEDHNPMGLEKVVYLRGHRLIAEMIELAVGTVD